MAPLPPPPLTPNALNPFNELIHSCNDDPHLIRTAYLAHLETRYSKQRASFLSSSFPGVNFDPILLRLLSHEAPVTAKSPTAAPPTGTQTKEETLDPRINLVFWARPPTRILAVLLATQARLRRLMPDIWFPEVEKLHMTILELASGGTWEGKGGVRELVEGVRGCVGWLGDVGVDDGGACAGDEDEDEAGEEEEGLREKKRKWRKGRQMGPLHEPRVTFDATGIAVGFLPCVPQQQQEASPKEVQNATPRTAQQQHPAISTHHHLRRDLYTAYLSLGLPTPAPRYILPTAHVTIARFVDRGATRGQLETVEGRRAFVAGVAEVNRWLQEEVWGTDGGEWMVGEEKGLDLRTGSCWYGGGWSVGVGEGLEGERCVC